DLTPSLPALHFFFPTTPRPPRPPLFPYTTLFRSRSAAGASRRAVVRASASNTTQPSPCTTTGLSSNRASPSSTSTRPASAARVRSEEHTSELQSLTNLVCRLLLEKKKSKQKPTSH